MSEGMKRRMTVQEEMDYEMRAEYDLAMWFAIHMRLVQKLWRPRQQEPA